MAVYRCLADLLDRVERIGRANKQYPLRALGDRLWVVGPEGDEGFFGNKPVYLRAVETKLHPLGVHNGGEGRTDD